MEPTNLQEYHDTLLVLLLFFAILFIILALLISIFIAPSNLKPSCCEDKGGILMSDENYCLLEQYDGTYKEYLMNFDSDLNCRLIEQ